MLTTEMMVVLGLLAFTVTLFVSELVRVDLAALIVMVLIGLLSTLPGLGGLADIEHRWLAAHRLRRLPGQRQPCQPRRAEGR